MLTKGVPKEAHKKGGSSMLEYGCFVGAFLLGVAFLGVSGAMIFHSERMLIRAIGIAFTFLVIAIVVVLVLKLPAVPEFSNGETGLLLCLVVFCGLVPYALMASWLEGPEPGEDHEDYLTMQQK